MKKFLAGIIVVLMAGILIFNHLDRAKKEGTPRSRNASSVEEPEGVSLPDRDYTRLASGASESGRAQFGDCVKSVKDVTADYGKMWDDFSGKNGDKKTFTEDDLKATSSLMSDYYSCKALAARDVKFCEALSNKGNTVFTPRYVCKERYNLIAYIGYMAGKTGNKTPCLEYFTEDRRKGLNLSAGEICAAATRGLPELCERLLGNPLKKSCRGHFPKSEADCDKSNPRCMEMLAIYGALKSGNPALCPESYKEYCEVFLNRDEAPCSAVKSRLLLTFCNISKRISEAEEEQKRKDEAEKTLAEINKRIRADKAAGAKK